MKWLCVSLVLSCSLAHAQPTQKQINDDLLLRLNPVIVSVEETPTQSPWHQAVRVPDRLVNNYQQSADAGKTWTALPTKTETLPTGWRRERSTTAFESSRLLAIYNCTDVDIAGFEASGLMSQYYLRYRTSLDCGKTWQDNPIESVPGVTRGLNAIYQGDIGCVPIRSGDSIIVPANASVLNPDGKTLYSPGGPSWWFYDVVILRGTWSIDGDLTWTSARIPGDVKKSVRGFMEPTLALLRDGRILCVMRGSNGGLTDPSYKLPSRKWASYSSDGGMTWTTPEEWSYASAPLVSPSSMSRLFNHSSGRIFWVGNDSDAANVQGSLPRYPLVMIEVDARTGKPLISSRTILATQTPADIPRGRLDISHMWVVEDDAGRIVVTFPVNHDAYKVREWRRIVLAL